jgi:DNA-binding NtrC family response regulator
LPGNVRDLENRLQRATLVCQPPIVTANDLGLPQIGGESTLPLGSGRPPAPSRAPTSGGASDPERVEIERVLVESGGVVARAAAMLGVSRQALYRRMDRLGIEIERRPKA